MNWTMKDRRRRLLQMLALGMALLGLAALLVAGVMRTDAGEEAARRTVGAVAVGVADEAADRLLTRRDAELPTPAAAGRAAARFLARLARASEQGGVDGVLDELTTRGFRAARGGTYRLAGVELQNRAEGLGGRIAVRTLPLGFRVEDLSSGEVRVAVWGLSVFGTSRSSVTGGFTTTRLSLIYDGRWLVDEISSEIPGPTPAMTDEAAGVPTPADAAVPVIAGFQPVVP